jgi:hypothetical protein
LIQSDDLVIELLPQLQVKRALLNVRLLKLLQIFV